MAVARGECTKIDSCSCQDASSGQIVSLSALADKTGGAALRATGPQGDVYRYNPCLAFTEAPGTQCDSVAICQKTSQDEYYNLGNQSTSNFVEENGTLILQYAGADTVEGARRVSTIYLQCKMDITTPVFEFLGETTPGQYYFNLTTRCACPGACPREESHCTPEGAKNCSCRLATGGLVNILSLDQPNAPLTVSTATASVTFNPCTGFDTGPGGSGCRDVTTCLYRSGAYYDFGDPSNADYEMRDGNVLLSYRSHDGDRKTNVQLVCDEGQRHYPKISIVGEPTETELNLELRSVCACPDGCYSPHVPCEKVDDCSCRLADGSGIISLRNLDNPVAPLKDSYIDKWNTLYNFYYNPCTNFTTPEPNDNCTNVAVCQILPNNQEDFSLGLQSSVQYRTSTVDSTIVSFNYLYGGDDRQTFIQMKCNASSNIPDFDFVKEEPYKTYHFELESRYACVQTSAEAKKEVTKPTRRRTRL